MKRLLFILFSFLSLSLSAQIVEPVHWSARASLQNDSVAMVDFVAIIDSGWHLYDIELPENGPVPTTFEFANVRTIGFMAINQMPDFVYDENFGMELAYYRDSVIFSQKIEYPLTEDYSIEVEYMACNDMQCLPPTTFQFVLSNLSSSGSNGISSNNSAAQNAQSSLWLLFFMGLLGGLLAIFTPCVWPIIPMTVSFFMKRTQGKKAITEALIYGAAIVLIYVGLGLLITLLFGASALNDIATNAIVNIIFFILLVVFALSFFGAFEITLPASWSTKLDSKARNTSGILSIFFMAFTLVIVSFSCTGPIIGTLLVEAAGRSLLAPTVGMLGFAIALALPFSLFALFPNWLNKLPRSGGWMDSFKIVLAFLELALSLKFLSVADLAYGWHLLDRETFIALWIAIFALLGIYLIGGFRFKHEQPAEGISITRFMLSIASFAFAIYMLPGLWGAPLKAISAFAPPIYTQDFVTNGETTHAFSPTNIEFDSVENDIALPQQLFEQAKAENKLILLDFSGYGCVNCRKMEAKVLSDSRVEQLLKNYLVVNLMVDDKTRLETTIEVSENGKKHKLKTVGDRWSYLQRTNYGANAQPYYVVLNADGEQIGTPYSYDEDVNNFINWLQK